MKHIVIFGAGKSSSCLVEYLIGQLHANNWKLTVLDANENAAKSRTGSAPHTEGKAIQVENGSERRHGLNRLI